MRRSDRLNEELLLEKVGLGPLPLSQPGLEFVGCSIVNLPDGSRGLDWADVRERPFQRGRRYGSRVTEHREALTRFIALRDASDDEYIQFASDFGVPTFDERGRIRPLWVVPSRKAQWKLAERRRVEPLELGLKRPVPLGWIFARARTMRSVLAVARNVWRGEKPDVQDWEEIGVPTREEIHRTVENGWEAVHGNVEALLERADVRPILLGHPQALGESREGKPRLELGGRSVWSLLAAQVAFAIARVDGLARCAGCGTPYTPRRRPRPGEDTYCSTCGRRAANRAAQSRKRERDRAGAPR
jgi:hypothetical protein